MRKLGLPTNYPITFMHTRKNTLELELVAPKAISIMKSMEIFLVNIEK